MDFSRVWRVKSRALAECRQPRFENWSLSTGLGMSVGTGAQPGADSPWIIGKGRPPNSTLTADFYRAIGSFVGAVELGQTLGQRVQTLFFAPTLAEHRANVTVAGLSKLLSECEVAVEGWLQAICKYLGTVDTPEMLKHAVCKLSSNASESRKSNKKKHQAERKSIGLELGPEGLAAYRNRGFDLTRFRVRPTSAVLRQGQVTSIQNDIRADATAFTGNLYADEEFLDLLGDMATDLWPNLNERKNQANRNWKSVLFYAWFNGLKDKVCSHISPSPRPAAELTAIARVAGQANRPGP